MINVLFCGNDKVFDGMLTTMLSIFKRSNTKEDFTFYIFTMDVTDIDPKYQPLSKEMGEFLDKVAKRYNPNNKVIVIDVIDLYNKEFRASPNESAYCSPYTLLRLLADLIPEIPDKILYLDVDLMFNRDIELIWNIDVEGYEYAAARDHYGKYLINPNYINAGVLLLNMKEMKKTGILIRARELIKTKKLKFADQSAIIRSTTRKRVLPQKYNDQKFLHKNRTIIRHFSRRLFWLPRPKVRNIKQWHIDEVHKRFHYHNFDDIYDEYLKLKNEFESSVS